jgi:LPS-assembly protein
LANITKYSFDEKNSFIFQTRRNRKLNLTEYYDLIYEYKNDCLTAGIKYKKSYYADEDLRPTENLLFTITLFPLTSYEYQANELIDQ